MAANHRAAGEHDVVDGVTLGEIWTPRNEAEVADALRQASAAGASVVVLGNRTKLDIGAPPRAPVLGLDCSGLEERIDHAADDLVVRASASVRLAALQEAVAAANQRLSFDEVVPGSTLGGVVGSGLSGPMRFRFGGLRDLVLGVRYVLADGTVAKAGSRVVKNVAGFDVSKLLCGSLGTLAVCTEVIVRLHPRPERQTFLQLRASPEEAARTALALARSTLAPSAIELNLADGGHAELAVLLEGFAAAAERRAAAAAAIVGREASVAVLPPPWWGLLPAEDVVRVTFPPARAADALALLARLALPTVVRGSIALGSLALGLPSATAASLGDVLGSLRPAFSALGGTVSVLRARPEAKAGVDLFGPVPGELVMRRVKERFDPDGILGPGRFLGDRR